MEMVIISAVVLFVLQYSNVISTKQLLQDSEQYFNKLKEDDYEFLVRAKYGDEVSPVLLFEKRIKNGIMAFFLFMFVFINGLNFLNVIGSVIAAFLVYKQQYSSLKKYYKAHLHDIDLLLPYYLKNLEILIQHYTVPVALGRSIQTAPNIFKPGLTMMIDRINGGDSSIEPYMIFAREYPVRDSMRMMRLLYRLGLGAQENKHEQLLAFSKTVSNLQNKAREQKYKERLDKMESKTMMMLGIVGGGVMIILLLSITMMFQM